MTSHRDSSQPLGPAVRRAGLVWAGLLGLLALTCGASYLDLGGGRLAVGLGVAAAKIALVGWFFMSPR